MDGKQLVSLADAALAELKEIQKQQEFPALSEYARALKQVASQGPESGLSGMQLNYMTTIAKNIGMMKGNMASVQTHAKHRESEIQSLMTELTKK